MEQLILSRPKTGNSIREVSIPQDAVELLKQEHAKHPDNPWMFPSGRTGEMYHPDSVVTLHKRILKDAGLEHIRFHDLRHTFATLALQNGVDVKTVSSMLGHYDAGFTLRTYTHVTRQMQQKCCREDGQLHGTDQIKILIQAEALERTRLPLRCSFTLSAHFRVWVRVWVRQLTHILTHTFFSFFATKKHRKPKFSMLFGAGGVTRTPDLLITNQLLYRLSYTSVFLKDE